MIASMGKFSGPILESHQGNEDITEFVEIFRGEDQSGPSSLLLMTDGRIERHAHNIAPIFGLLIDYKMSRVARPSEPPMRRFRPVRA